MKKFVEGVLLGTTLIALQPFTAIGTASEQPTEQVLNIHIYDFAQKADHSLKMAMIEVDKIFKRAAIRTIWEQPPITLSEARFFDFEIPTLRWSYSGEQRYLVVRIIEDLPSTGYPGALGFALPYAQSGVNVEIFYRRLAHYANLLGMPAEVVLAYSLAHEIGHVLLRSPNHVMSGIMQTHCDAESWNILSSGMAAFLPEQSLQMRNELRWLNGHEKASREKTPALVPESARSKEQ